MIKKQLISAGAFNVESVEVDETVYPKLQLYRFLYKSDEFNVSGYCVVSNDIKEPTPALIFNRGGNRDFGMLDPTTLLRLAKKSNYVVLGSNYRGNDGGTGVEDYGNKDVQDVINLTTLALNLAFVKKRGVYMLGRSRGGMMTYRACAMDERIIAAAIGAGITDCRIMYTSREDSMKEVFHELVGGNPDTHPEAFSVRSAVDWAEKINQPLFIGHGDEDVKVIPEQARNLVEKLKRLNKTYSYEEYEHGKHSLEGTTFIEDAFNFFKKYQI